MKIGVFDSGIGGLVILRTIVKKLPQYDYIYLGDTARVPYGNRSQATIYKFASQAVDYLFKQNCQLIIIACNTASTRALRRIQQEYLSKHYPNRKVLGIVVPTVEVAGEAKANRIGLLATQSAVDSGVYPKELKKVSNKKVFQAAAPKLVPLIESGNEKSAAPILQDYVKLLQRKHVDAILLACTHYPRLRKQLQKIVGKDVQIISQDDFMPAKLKGYLTRHPEIEKKLSRKKTRKFLVTDITPATQALAQKWFGGHIRLQKVTL